MTVLPATATGEEILAHKPDGVFLSNGPGDPAATGEYAVPAIRGVIDAGMPTFGICLGHQMLGLALGGKTMKMHQGHHGANHPVKDLTTGKVEITSMNHGFAVDTKTLPDSVEETHVSLFDGSNCGLRLKDRPVFSVQYHPEASPGPARQPLPVPALRRDDGREGWLSRPSFISKGRLDALTDGVYAFAMTLLVINIELPDDFHPKNSAELLAGLGEPAGRLHRLHHHLRRPRVILVRTGAHQGRAGNGEHRLCLGSALPALLRHLHAVFDEGARQLRLRAGGLALWRQHDPPGADGDPDFAGGRERHGAPLPDNGRVELAVLIASAAALDGDQPRPQGRGDVRLFPQLRRTARAEAKPGPAFLTLLFACIALLAIGWTLITAITHRVDLR